MSLHQILPEHVEELERLFTASARSKGFDSLADAAGRFADTCISEGMTDIADFGGKPSTHFFNWLRDIDVSMFITNNIYFYATELELTIMYEKLAKKHTPTKQCQTQ